MERIYLDNAATTALDPLVLEAMMPYLTSQFGNPSSIYSYGRESRLAIENARKTVAKILNAHPAEIFFTSGGTESSNTAITAAVRDLGCKHIISSVIEHHATTHTVEFLYHSGEAALSYVKLLPNGHIDLEDLERLLAESEEKCLVTLMHANNETGVIFPVEEIAAEVRKRGIVFHTDSVQTAGKVPIDVKASPIDMLSLSGHKLHAPKGVGVLYVRKGTRFSPFLVGGHQEGGRRGGTENVASIVGLGAAADLAGEELANGSIDRMAGLRDRLEKGLLDSVPRSMVNGTVKSRLPNTTSISFEYVEGEAILLLMDQLGICASSGSACTSGSLEPSHVLRAMGVPFTAAHGSIRYSLSTFNTEDEIDYIVENMPPVIDRLREMSPFWEQNAG